MLNPVIFSLRSWRYVNARKARESAAELRWLPVVKELKYRLPGLLLFLTSHPLMQQIKSLLYKCNLIGIGLSGDE